MSLRQRQGFTLVEVLVTTSLMAVVGAATVGALAGGIRVWERASDIGMYRQAVLVSLAQMRRDLQNARMFLLIPFDGNYDRITFASLSRERLDDEGPPELGRLGYFLDERSQIFCRSFVPYRLMKRVRLTDRCQAVLEGVTRLRFSYFGSSEGEEAVGWAGSWTSPQAPLAVKVDLTVRRRGQPLASQSAVISLIGAIPHDATP